MFPPAYFPPPLFTPSYFPPGFPTTPTCVVRLLLVWQPTLPFALSLRGSPMDKTLRLIRAQDVVLEGKLTPPGSIAGWSLAFTVRDCLGGTLVLSKTTAAGISIADAGRGVIRITLARLDTASLEPSINLGVGAGYVWDVKRTDVGHNLVLARGQLVLEREVTA